MAKNRRFFLRPGSLRAMIDLHSALGLGMAFFMTAPVYTVDLDGDFMDVSDGLKG